MKILSVLSIILLLLTGCSSSSSNIGFGIGGVVGGSNGGTEVIATQDGIHGRIAAGGDFVH